MLSNLLRKKRAGGAARPPAHPIVTARDKVRVIVRVRAFSADELLSARADLPPLQVAETANTVQGITFDRVFGMDAETRSVFAEITPLVDSWIEGYNACVFAYGQTGSGKTHTMMGAGGGKGELNGVIPLAAEYALERLDIEDRTAAALDPSAASRHRIRVTYVELYNNDFRDLLKGFASTPGAPPLVGVESTATIGVREDPSGRVYLDGASEYTVRSVSDLLALIEHGARYRATDRTDMNAHSSRSHAILTLHQQHRWRDGPDGPLKQSQSVLHLVDLAGSEYAKRTGNQGDKLKESIAINTGLFALGNVISALSGHADGRVGNHIPYRDSLLTRVLQSALGGDSLTLMVVCCSPAGEDVAESIGSLRYAERARRINATAKLQIADFVPEPSPLDGDIADPDAILDRRCWWVEVPGHGDVYARVMGDPSDGELILFVHGSGPTNSSTFWCGIMWDMYVRRLPRRPYFMVAIDCPGYGRSPGDRQTIRSQPGAFLAGVVNALGFSDALCLVGSSQGACAVFNALLERATLARHVAVMDPVGHDVFRYKQVKQPALLVFDTEDDGHPVKVGRWMRDNLPTCTYFEFAASQEPFWHCDHMGDEILKLVEGTNAPTSVKRKPALPTVGAALAAQVRLAAGLVNWGDNRGFGEPLKQVAAGLLPVPTATQLVSFDHEGDLERLTLADRESTIISTEACDVVGAEWIAEIDAKSHRVYYSNPATLEVMWRRPRHGLVFEQPPSNAIAPAEAQPTGPIDATASLPAPRLAELFDDEVEAHSKSDAFAPMSLEEVAAAETARITRESATTDCMQCGDLLTLKSKRFVECRHVVCELCYLALCRWTGRCCVCHQLAASLHDTAVRPSGIVPSEDPAMAALMMVIAQHSNHGSREAEAAAAAHQRSLCHQVVLEYGNTAEGRQGAAFIVTASCRIAQVLRGKSPVPVPTALACVAFDINPDFPKSAVKVTSAPFSLTRTMSTRFTCSMIITFAGPAGEVIPPIIVPYTISHEPRTVRRVVLLIRDRAAVDGEQERKRRNAKRTPLHLDTETAMEFLVVVP